MNNLETTPDPKAEFNSDYKNSSNIAGRDGFEIHSKQKRTGLNGKKINIRRIIKWKWT